MKGGIAMYDVPKDTIRVNSSSHHHVNVTLLELVQADVALTFRGREWFGCCPFHPDKTPSFSVNPEKSLYYCFGCGAAGDAITYLRRTRGYTFAEACQETGKDRPRSDRGQRLRAMAVKEQRARYDAWWHEKLAVWNALLDDIRWTEITYHDQCEKLGETMSDASCSFWLQRLRILYFQQTVMQQLFDLNDAERIATWREEAGGQ
jgi:hypothetical protein